MPDFWIDVKVLVTLMLLLGASAGMFWVLVRRWESHRQWLALAEWGREHGFFSQPCDGNHLPSPVNSLAARQLSVRLCLASKETVLIQFQTAAVQQPDGTPGATGSLVWNLLIRRLPAAWRPTGLRPSHARVSALDLFSLSSFPSLGTTERFMIFGTDSQAAGALSASMTRSLLPPDIGLLLHGEELVLDFSDRPFDEIEFNRMRALADQIVEKLPAAG